jgi:hypothetical protein
MNESIESDEKSFKKRLNTIRTFLFITVILFLMILYYILIDFGTIHLVSFLIVLFIFLIVLGPIINYGKNRNLFDRFKRKNKAGGNKRDEDTFKIKTTSKRHPIDERINLEFTYRKALIHKCPKCGFMVTSSMKTCPNCGQTI